MIRLRTLGNAEIETDKTIITPSQEVVFAAALFLTTQRECVCPRQSLAGLLWPDVDRPVQSHRLRQTVFQLKKLGIPIGSELGKIYITDTVHSDLGTLPEALTQSTELPNLAWLPDYKPSFSDSFSEWLEVRRTEIQRRIAQMLMPQFLASKTSGDWGTMERLARAGLSIEPLNEVWVLGLSEALALQGQKQSAIALLEQYVKEVGGLESPIAVPAEVLRRRINSQTRKMGDVSADVRFVGRHHEMTDLIAQVENAIAGRGGACLVTGDPGIGKSRLCAEVAHFSALLGVGVIRVGCKPHDLQQALSIFVKLIPELRELPGALGCAPTALAWLKRLTDFTSSDGISSQLSEPAILHTNFRQAVFELFDAVCEEQPLLLVVDDVQWLDKASAALFSSLLDWAQTKSLFCLFNSRPSSQPFEEFVGKIELPMRWLSPLDSNDSQELVRAMGIEQRKPATGDVRWIIEAADGNPFFLQELTKQWLESGRQGGVPPTILTVLHDRLLRLTPSALHVLEASVILGENATVERIERLLEYPAYELLSSIEELATTGMLRPASPGTSRGEELLLPRHDLISSAVQSRLAPATLGYIHRRCGVVLDREISGDSISTSLLRASAVHWHHAGDSQKALTLAQKCANHLLEIGLTEDAAQVLEGALIYCSDISTRRQVLTQIAESRFIGREWAALLSVVGRIRKIDGSNGNPVHDDLELAEFEALRNRTAPIQELFNRTLICVHDDSVAPNHRIKAAALALKLATALPDLEAIENIYQRLRGVLANPEVDERSRLQVEVVYATMCGNLEDAVDLARQRVQFERIHGTASHLSTALSDLTFVLRRTGPVSEAEAAIAEAYDLAFKARHFAAARDCASRMVGVLVDSDRNDLGLWVDRAKQTFEHEDEAHMAYSVLCYLSRVALKQDRVSEAKLAVCTGATREWLNDRKGWLAASLALALRIKMAEKCDETHLEPEVTELLQLYDSIASLGGQDYEIAALCCALRYRGDLKIATDVLADYVFHRRRDVTPYNSDLRRVVELLAPDRSAHPEVILRTGKAQSQNDGLKVNGGHAFNG